ncbi:MAG: hypothetical protein QOI07_916 [Verrucomicrobiota bacterium]|jgi:hypothetical protein
MSTPNYATSIAPKPFVAAGENTPPAAWFYESTRPLPGGVTLPTYPGTLNSYERAEVARFIADPTDATLASLRLPDAIDKAIEFQTVFADPAYQAWEAAVKLDRIAQWKLSVGSSVSDNVDSVPASLDETGAGGTPPSTSTPPVGGGEPDQVAAVEYNIATGTLGSAITLGLSTTTGGSSIHYRLNGGPWSNYSVPVPMSAGNTMDFYASAPGFADSDTDHFENS